MIPLRILSVTSEPRKMAPVISQTAPTIQACFSVRAPEPTLVPKELAASFAGSRKFY